MSVMEKVVKKMPMDGAQEIRDNLAYWLSRPPAERIAEVFRLREIVCGNTQRLQRVARVISFSNMKDQSIDLQKILDAITNS